MLKSKTDYNYRIDDIALRSQYKRDYPYDRKSVAYGARKMGEVCANELMEHEKYILWKFENILGKIILDQTSFDNIRNDFKKVLVNQF